MNHAKKNFSLFIIIILTLLMIIVVFSVFEKRIKKIENKIHDSVGTIK